MGKIIKILVIIVASAVIVIAMDLVGKAVEPVQQREVVSLAGQWRFQPDPARTGQKEKWFEKELAHIITLPGSMAENGYGNDVTVKTQWTGGIKDKSWFTEDKYARYRHPGSVKIPFWLTPVKHYVGPTWYQKEINIPENWQDKRIVLFLERCHWETKVWVNGVSVGMRDSLSAAHVYDLTNVMTPGKHLLTIRVDNSIKYNVGRSAHSVSDHTQTNWNGIIGRIELQATDRVWISDVQTYPDVKRKSVKVHIAIGGGVDTQKTLPFGTPNEVYREVRERIEIFSEGSGFVFNSIHNIQSNVPLENILAIFKAVRNNRV